MDALTRHVILRREKAPSGFLPRVRRRLMLHSGQVLALLAVAYVVLAVSNLGINGERILRGIDQGAKFIARLFPPNFAARWDDIVHDMVESIEMAIMASVIGIALSLPLGLLGARNLMPPAITWPIRFLISLFRAFNPIIIGIIFVKAVGFGPLAGVLTLSVASIGFIGKLFIEAIEEISLKQVEAVRASGAPFLSLIRYGVMPQVSSRFVGFAMYQFDSNLRNSTTLGIVGAGGIGGTLFAAFQRFDYRIVSAIVIVIIALIILDEFVSERVRRLFE
ncbi:MAG: phosphonate ABC transporter, permease protein PhnE [Spirochaetaceae bacterium]|nr:phosphonate ABC transporter, permease protein PhnE [Spirochaetaceae bacterium]